MKKISSILISLNRKSFFVECDATNQSRFRPNSLVLLVPTKPSFLNDRRIKVKRNIRGIL